MADNTDHKKALEQLCRLCACSIKTTRYDKTNFVDDFKVLFNADVLKEDSSIYPQSFCLNCYSKMVKMKQGKSSNLMPTLWHKHRFPCVTCMHLEKIKKGGGK